MPRPPYEAWGQTAMTPEHAFLRAVKESPADDGLRLIFADWLEENGQPERAEFIRIQVERACLPHDHARQARLGQREEELLQACGQSWLGAWAEQARFARGLIHLECEVEEFRGLLTAEGAEARLHWIESLKIGGAWEDVGRLLGEPSLPYLASFSLWTYGMGDGGVPALAALPHPGKLKSLDLSGNGIGDAGAAALASSPRLAHLTSLNLGCVTRYSNHPKYNSIGDAGVAALASSPYLGNLTSLDLSGNPIGDAGAAALAASPHLGNLTSLGIDCDGITDVGVSALALSPHLGNLTWLRMSDRHVSKVGKARLLQRFGGPPGPGHTSDSDALGLLTRCDDPFSLQRLAARICGNSNLRFAWQFYRCNGLGLRSPEDARQALDAIIATPGHHRFLRESLRYQYQASLFRIDPLHDHFRIAASDDFEETLASLAGGYELACAYGRKSGTPTDREKQEVRELFGSAGSYCAYELLPGDDQDCPACREIFRSWTEPFCSWFDGVAWDWCLFASWPGRDLFWMGCLTDTD